MTMVAKQTRSNRIVAGTSVPHPCGDPSAPPEADREMRKEIVRTALQALQTNVDGSTIFMPEITFAAK
jgi:glycine reductase